MRQVRDWSQTQAFEALRDGLDLGPRSRAAYIKLDMGERPPRPREQQFLIEYFGSGPDDIPTIGADKDPLVEAINGQTEAINALVAELRGWSSNPRLAPYRDAELVDRVLGSGGELGRRRARRPAPEAPEAPSPSPEPPAPSKGAGSR